MAISPIRKHLWLINYLTTRPGATFNDIDNAWARAYSINPDGEKLPVRTFNNWKKDVYDEFGIRLKCNRSTRGYTIEHLGDIKSGSIYEWILNAFTVSNLLTERDALQGRILLENVPSGHQFLTTIMEALKMNQRVKMTYHKFEDPEGYTMFLEPYFVKLYERRWYVIGRNVVKDEIRTYALDRMEYAEILPDTFKMPKKFDPEEYFADCYGITRLPGAEPMDVKLKVAAGQVRYLRSLPLHATQKEIETYPDYSLFTLRVLPTFDFLQALMYLREFTEVLEPLALREQMAEIVGKMAETYSIKN